jgi:integrase
VGGPSIVRLVSDWNDRCKVEYRKDGRPTGEHLIHRAACRFVVDLTKSVFPGLLAAEFGPVHLREAREQMIAAGLSRTTIRAYQSRVVQMFGWAVGEDLIPAEVYQRLQRVGHLRPHATEAKEKVAKVAAKWREVEKVIRHLHADPSRRAVIEAIVRTHWYIGGRPSELVAMRPEDLDRSEEVWTYSPASHKNQHREKPLTYWIGPKCQALLLPLLERCGPGELVFRYPPRVYAKKGGGGTADHHEPRATIPITEATATAPHPQRGKSRPISRREYGRRVKKACEAAGVKPWTPHQLRHARATEVRRIYESNAAAAAAIGDSEEVTRAIYTAGSGVPNEVARRIARETG